MNKIYNDNCFNVFKIIDENSVNMILVDLPYGQTDCEGDLIMDFTMGSGTSIIAAINTKRNYIGIEMDELIFKTAEKRINNILLNNNIDNEQQSTIIY